MPWWRDRWPWKPRPGRGDVVGRDRVAQDRQRARADDVGDGVGLVTILTRGGPGFETTVPTFAAAIAEAERQGQDDEGK